MLGLGKKRRSEEQVIQTDSAAPNIAAEMGLKEYVSFDSVKAHLVDILEENRRLKREAEESKDRNYKCREDERKQKEIALIEADEWKKRSQEKDKEIRELKTTIDKMDLEIERLKNQQNSLEVKAEMALATAERERKQRSEAFLAGQTLKEALKKYYKGDWEKASKTALVELLKKIIQEEERSAAAAEAEEPEGKGD